MGIMMYLFKHLGISLPPHLAQVFPRSGMMKGWYIRLDLLYQLTLISLMDLFHMIDGLSSSFHDANKCRGPLASWDWRIFCNNLFGGV